MFIRLKFLFITSFRNLWRNPRRTIISLTAIAAAAAALIVFQSFVEGVKKTFRKNVVTANYGHFQIMTSSLRQKESDDPFANQITNFSDIRKAIEADVAPLAFASPRLEFFALLSTGDRSFGGKGIGVDAEEEIKFLTLTQVHEGKELAHSSDQSIYVGFKLAEQIGIKPGDNITVVVNTAQGSINAIDVEVVGTFKSGVTELDKSVFYMHHRVVESLLGTQGAPKILIGFKDDNEMQFIPKLNETMLQKFPGVLAVHWQELAEFFFNTMGWLEGQFKVFRLIILLIAFLSIVNVFTISLMERIGEFGTLRAIGTFRTEITLMIFIESIFQAIIGTMLGILLAILVIKWPLASGITMPPPPLMSVPFLVKFDIPWNGVWVTSILTIIIAGGSGIFPAFKMGKINIVEALGRNV